MLPVKWPVVVIVAFICSFKYFCLHHWYCSTFTRFFIRNVSLLPLLLASVVVAFIERVNRFCTSEVVRVFDSDVHIFDRFSLIY